MGIVLSPLKDIGAVNGSIIVFRWYQALITDVVLFINKKLINYEGDVQLGIECVVFLSLELVFVDGPVGIVRKTNVTVPDSIR